MGAAREFRSLTALVDAASSARVLNLAAQARRRLEPIPLERRLFHTPALERSLIIKHRLRADERDHLPPGCQSATKVLLPIDPSDLSVGAASLFIGERGWQSRLVELAGTSENSSGAQRDLDILSALDQIPSLDPFLVRGHLSRRNIEIDPSYFRINDADLQRMSSYVVSHIHPLVELCFENVERGSAQGLSLANKLLRAEFDESMDPLKATLRLEGSDFDEGMFCWKGLIYYKWVLSAHVGPARAVAWRISQAEFKGRATPEERTYIQTTRRKLAAQILSNVYRVSELLAKYDEAFLGFTQCANPMLFRNFLLSAPELFTQVGERLGAIQHVVSFWRFRCAQAGDRTPDAPELADLMRDFEASLGVRDAGYADSLARHTAAWSPPSLVPAGA